MLTQGRALGRPMPAERKKGAKRGPLFKSSSRQNEILGLLRSFPGRLAGLLEVVAGLQIAREFRLRGGLTGLRRSGSRRDLEGDRGSGYKSGGDNGKHDFLQHRNASVGL